MTKPRKHLLPAWLTAVTLAAAAAGAQAQDAAAAKQESAPPKSAPAAGGKSDSGSKTTPEEQPNTVILGDKWSYDDIKKTSDFIGNVTMTRGLMTLTADELHMREDAQGNQYGTALANPGKVVTVRQERPENFEVIQGVGRRAEYDGRTNTYDLIGQAVVTRYICGKPFDTIRGQKVRYHEKTSTYEAIGGPDSSGPGGRVRTVMEPRARIDAAIAECRKQHGGKPPAEKSPVSKAPTTSSPSTTGQAADHGKNDEKMPSGR